MHRYVCARAARGWCNAPLCTRPCTKGSVQCTSVCVCAPTVWRNAPRPVCMCIEGGGRPRFPAWSLSCDRFMRWPRCSRTRCIFATESGVGPTTNLAVARFPRPSRAKDDLCRYRQRSPRPTTPWRRGRRPVGPTNEMSGIVFDRSPVWPSTRRRPDAQGVAIELRSMNNLHLRREMLLLASDAAEYIERETGDASNHWATLFRESAKDENLTRWDLHSSLRNASDALAKRFPNLSARLDELRRDLDAMPSGNP
jgi:hypothetical protein